MRKPIVFISSTSDLREERQALARSLRCAFEAYLHEEDRLQGKSPREHCRRMIEKSAVFVGLLGGRHGSPFQLGNEPLSICEWEFDSAYALRSRIELMMLLKTLAPDEIEPEQEAFRKRVADFHSGVWCKTFDSTENLVQCVHKALVTWLAEYWVRKETEATRRTLPWLNRMLLISTVPLVVLILVIASASFGSHLTTNSILALCTVAATLGLSSAALMLAESKGSHFYEPKH
jgi:hypothetical protein